MPFAPPKPCRSPRCAGFAAPNSGWCQAHAPLAREVAKIADTRRGTAASRGYGHKWQMASRGFRQKHPICGGFLTRTAAWSPALALAYAAVRSAFGDRAQPIAFLGSLERRAFCAPPLPNPHSAIRTPQSSPVPYFLHRPTCRKPAELVDHIHPHKGDMVLFWDAANWQSLCKQCHDIKTATFDHEAGEIAEARRSGNTDRNLATEAEQTGGWL